jgi:hypothetical protein
MSRFSTVLLEFYTLRKLLKIEIGGRGYEGTGVGDREATGRLLRSSYGRRLAYLSCVFSGSYAAITRLDKRGLTLPYKGVD